MKFIADYYLTHSLSPTDAAWPYITFPYNTLIYLGVYDCDMVIGQGYTQPDKAGSFGDELITLYKMTGKRAYLDALIKIANALASNTSTGDADHSPLLFKIHTGTGEIGKLKSNSGDHDDTGLSSYITNWVGILQLLEKLSALETGDVEKYKQAHSLVLDWMMTYPLKTNKWGAFF